MNFLSEMGHGNPNDPLSAYQNVISQLYAVAYTVKMSYKGVTQKTILRHLIR